jgi:hypothetical protein
LLIPSVPLALRERIAQLNARVHVVCHAAAALEQGKGASWSTTERWLADWKRHAALIQERILRRWRRGELTPEQAVRALDDELAGNAPRILRFP